MNKKICVICGNEFTKNVYNQQACNKECRRTLKNIRTKEWIEKNKQHHLDCKKQIRLKNKESIKEYNREYKQKNKKRMTEYRTEYRNNHLIESRKNENKYRKQKKIDDLNYKIKTKLRTRISVALRLQNGKKAFNTTEVLGCTIEDFKKYLESKFTDIMSWENYGPKGWHIDHIEPCIKFDLTNPNEQKKCFHYSNLQPLWWLDNLKKGAK